ncbi:MAG: ribulose 1,5-bisphosphate carboxylase, partial [Myxococcota bacterium]
MDLMRVSYRLAVGAGEAQERAERLALEQSVEVPRAVVRDRQVEERALGRVEAVTQLSDSSALARIAFPLAATAKDPAQLLNLLF